jgi:predicted PurR-regulated permease PerM
METKPYTFDRVFRIALSLICIVGVIWLFNYLSDVLIPFAVAFLLAYLINPIVCWVQKKIPHRMAAVLITLVALSMISMLSVYLVFQPVKSEVVRMKDTVLKVKDTPPMVKLSKYLGDVGIEIFDSKEQSRRDQMMSMLKNEKYMSFLKTGASKLFPVVKIGFQGVIGFSLWMLGLTVIALYLVFILADYQTVKVDWKELLPPKWKANITEFVEEFDDIMNQHFRAQAIVAALVGVLFAIGFSVIGLPLAIILGLVIGAMNMIPYLQVLGLLPAGLLAVMMAVETQTGIPAALIKVTAIFAIVQVIQDAILVPRIMGKVTGLKPAMILLSISIWGKIMGVLGLLIALPLTCLFLAYYRRFILKKIADHKKVQT